jgi:acyl-CoA reductase-like NAD-dependent aldehyde dehydrogenase
VHDKVYDAFVGTFTCIARATKVGDGLAPDSRMGPLANPRRVNAIEAFVADASAQRSCPGCRGAFPRSPPSRPSPRLARANKLPFGLASYAFTRDGRRR